MLDNNELGKYFPTGVIKDYVNHYPQKTHTWALQMSV